MRVKSPKTVITFASTSDALAMEAAGRELAIPGRTIPVPSQISAGCGLAWCVEPADRDAALTAIEAKGLAYEGVFTVELY